jgi:hypothetical protein
VSRRRYVDGPAGLALVPEDPPLRPGDLEIDLAGLTEDSIPELAAPRTITPRIDEVALAELVARSRGSR